MADVTGTEDAEVLDGVDGVTEGDDLIVGLGGADSIFGLGGSDFILGGTGADDINGGNGIDIASYVDSDASVVVSLLAGGVGGTANGDIYTSIEGLAGSTFNDVLTGDDLDNLVSGDEGNDLLQGRGGIDALQGNAGADTLQGGDGDDNLVGGAGPDDMDGGAGLDTADYSESGAPIAVSFTSGGVGGDANGDVYANIEGINGSAFDDLLSTDDLDNFILGGDGNDVGQGRGGSDFLQGDAGNDTLQAGEGDDAVRGGVGADDLSGGAGSDDLGGEDGNDSLAGGAGDDVLNGGDGTNTLDGGAGADLVTFADSTVGLFVNLAAGTTSAGDTLKDIEQVLGSLLKDTINGSGGADRLIGSDGDDRLTGGDGADELIGGDGADVARYTASSAGVVVDLGQGTGVGGAAEGDVLAEIEGLAGSNFDDLLTGSAESADRLNGQGGNDQLDGSDGNDKLNGGAGDDVLIGGAGADSMVGAGGIDAVFYGTSTAAVSVDLVTDNNSGGDAQGDILSDFEIVIGSDFDDVLAGNKKNNVLLGNAGADTLFGRKGSDNLTGGAGADEIAGGEGRDTSSYSDSAAGVQINLATGKASGGDAKGDKLTGIENLDGSARADRLTGNGLANTLDGGRGNDTLGGGAGADELRGGAGADRMTGGFGPDSFVLSARSESRVGANRHDTIVDFKQVQGDSIDLSAIDADTSTPGADDGFTFIGGAAFTGAGQLRFNAVTHILSGNVNANLAADFEIFLPNVTALDDGSFIL